MVWKLTITDKLIELAKAAIELRKAGVTRVSLGELQLDLTEWAPPAAAPEQQPSNGVVHIEYDDAFDDPDTYGTSGRVPGFPRPPRDDE